MVELKKEWIQCDRELLKSLLPLTNKQYPDITEISVQSDNASCLASHNIITYIHRLNKRLEDLGLTAAEWIYPWAQTGKGRLDTHFSFVNALFQA
jgi:hypothetical protein